MFHDADNAVWIFDLTQHISIQFLLNFFLISPLYICYICRPITAPKYGVTPSKFLFFNYICSVISPPSIILAFFRWRFLSRINISTLIYALICCRSSRSQSGVVSSFSFYHCFPLSKFDLPVTCLVGRSLSLLIFCSLYWCLQGQKHSEVTHNPKRSALYFEWYWVNTPVYVLSVQLTQENGWNNIWHLILFLKGP